MKVEESKEFFDYVRKLGSKFLVLATVSRFFFFNYKYRSRSRELLIRTGQCFLLNGFIFLGR
jgi:hypothetical protein